MFLLGDNLRSYMMKLAISINKKKIASFCEKYHILSLALFGSVLTPRFNSASDVDVLVQFCKLHIPTLFEIVDIEEELSNIVGRKVDLRTPNELSPYFRDEVLAQARVIYGS